MKACNAWTWNALWKAWWTFWSWTVLKHDLCCSSESYVLESQSVDCVVVDITDKVFQCDF